MQRPRGRDVQGTALRWWKSRSSPEGLPGREGLAPTPSEVRACGSSGRWGLPALQLAAGLEIDLRGPGLKWGHGSGGHQT